MSFTDPATIEQLLQFAAQQFSAISDTPLLDAQLLLAEALGVDKVYFYTWPAKTIDAAAQKKFLTWTQRRSLGEPIAYILGYKEFWSLRLKVTTDTLIPRPETELLVELALKLLAKPDIRLLELGTGSGAIAIAIARERPDWHITACDISSAALAIAKENAEHYQCSNIRFIESNWLQQIPTSSYDAIISNPPYIASTDLHLQHKTLKFEPQSALVSGDTGLDALTQIIQTAPAFLKKNGLLMLEHGYDQHSTLQQLMAQNGFTEIQDHPDLQGKSRVITARYTHGTKFG